VAIGKAVIVTVVVTDTMEHPPEAGIVYVTVYVPAVLVDGVMAPVDELIVNPTVDVKVPPV